MKILAIADIESPYFWDHFKKDKVEDIDLILSAGDLDPEYLSFLVTMSHAPVLYIHGNHDNKYDTHPPLGCECIEDKVYTFNGVRIYGLGGSMEYSGGKYQFTEKEMRHRIRRSLFHLWRNKGFDILLTHAPAQGINDGKDLPHRGFDAFRKLIERYQPRFFIHGHVHKTYSYDFKQFDQCGDTTVINAFGYCLFEY